MRDDQQLERARVFLAAIPGAAEKASARALNKAVDAGREAAVTAIVDRYAVRASDVRSKIAVTTATPESLSVSVVARSPSLSLGYFPHTPEQAGTGGRGKPALRAEVLRGLQKDVGGAFIATINGQPRVMIRTGGTTKTGRSQIRSVYSVPIATMLGAESVRSAVEARAMAVLDERLTVEIDRELGRVA